MLLLISLPLWPQVNVFDESLSFVGMGLDELIERFGPPKSVAAVRGNELWQDDVVFQYSEGDFYIHRDRVWQVRLVSALGVSNRDRKSVVLLALGSSVEDRGDHLLLPISGNNWPLMLKVNVNNSGLVTDIFIYRSDF